MLSRDAYLSRATNIVYVGDSAREALDHERQHDTPYSPYGPDDNINNQVYIRSPRGLPLHPEHVKQLRALYKDRKK
jgi:hypothetical protein